LGKEYKRYHPLTYVVSFVNKQDAILPMIDLIKDKGFQELLTDWLESNIKINNDKISYKSSELLISKTPSYLIKIFDKYGYEKV
jgi:hypothetical protein